MCWGFTLAKVFATCRSKAGAEHSSVILRVDHREQAWNRLIFEELGNSRSGAERFPWPGRCSVRGVGQDPSLGGVC